LLGKNLSIAAMPLKIVRGWMQHLYDETDAPFLDFTTMCHRSHSHPRGKAVHGKIALLITTRYSHDLATGMPSNSRNICLNRYVFLR
jgi:hypothetical protein